MKVQSDKINPYLSVEYWDMMRIYRIHFRSLSDIELYINKYPEVNRDIFYGLNSINGTKEFAGESLEAAMKYLIGGYDKGYPRFLEIKREIDSVNYKYYTGRRSIPAFVGSRPNVPGYIAGSPKTMYAARKTERKKFIDIYFDLSYPANTTENQILNRGILTLNLITLLEEHNIGINFKVFQSCYVDDEVFCAEIVLKKPDQLINVRQCYYPLCSKEFLRRVMARVLESIPVKNNWGLSYGQILPDVLIRKYYHIDEDKILIASPDEMGINGNNIYEDADNFLSHIKLREEIHFPKYRKED